MFCGEKRNSFLKQSSISQHFILLLAFINNAKKDTSALNSQHDTAVYRYPSIIEKLRNKLSKTG